MTTLSRALKAAMPAALLLAVATPVLAQTAPPPTPGAAATSPQRGQGRGGMHHRGMFATLSEPGRATMREAMKGDMAVRQADRAAVKAARDRMLTVLEAERLDVAALKKAMADERNAANASRERMQASMAAGFAKLSVADRRAFVAEAKAMRARMDERMKGWKNRRGGGGDDMSEPPMMF